MHVPGLKLSGVRSYQGTSRSRLLLPKEEKDRSDTRLKDTSEPTKKDTSEPKIKDRSDRAPVVVMVLDRLNSLLGFFLCACLVGDTEQGGWTVRLWG